jgi:3-deoxy-D-manno-octulosonate 8-phosphate phosphatase (KDO 8-P phosphatase)
LRVNVDADLARDIAAVRFVVFDFDGVFTDNHVYVSQDGTEMVRCWRGDGLGLRELERLGVGIAIISTETNPVVTARSQKLQIECTQGCNDKLAALDELRARHDLGREQVAFVGNDINDKTCLEAVRVPIVVGDAHESVLPLARYRTKAVGGRGAVREVCDLIASVIKSVRQ